MGKKKKKGPGYRARAEFRYHIRRFLDFSDRVAKKRGVEPQQHQLMLAVAGAEDGRKPTIGYLSARLHIQHHSAVELVDRCVRAGLVERVRDVADRRKVVVHLTRRGQRLLQQISADNTAELQAAARSLVDVLNTLLAGEGPAP
jgi:DNA-binding MarR family transcriptional regulator